MVSPRSDIKTVPGAAARVSAHPAPFDGYRDVVRPEWIDHNGHLNVGYYGVVFDLATDAFFDSVGFDAEHQREHRVATFTLEAHFTYQREVLQGEALRFTTQLLGYDEKRIHYLHRMWRGRDGVLSATNELVSLHVSRATRRAAPMHASVQERLDRVAEAHAALPPPPEVGRIMGLSTNPPSMD